jgi:PAS domain S-box-containing protein
MYTNAKILITDDEKMVLKTLNMLLNIEGFKNVECFENPIAALKYLKTNKVDLIISDFIMPQINGIEFLAEAKKMWPETTEILLTGYADKENAIKAINEVGIYKYIEKPWDNTNLIINIKNGIERSQLKQQVKDKIKELEDLNASLEKTVQERTLDLSKTNLKLSTIIGSCADGILIFDENYKIQLANKATEEMYGLSEKDICGKNFFEMVINEKNQKFEEFLQERSGIYLRDFYLIDYKNEKKIPIEINIAPVFDSENSFFIASVRNVAAQKENEILKDDFITTLTHDLRTPLLAAISGLDFLLKRTLGELSEKQEVMLSTMKKSNEDMLGLVNALLEVYRYESGKLFLSKEQFCLNELVKDCKNTLLPLLSEKSLGVEFDLENKNGDFIINADKHELKRVILNLLGNAIKLSEDNSKIIISTEKNDKDVLLSVQDFACGLSEEDCKELFKRFSQGTSKKRACSTGLVYIYPDK